MQFPLPMRGSGEGGLAQFVKELPPELQEELAEGGNFWESLLLHFQALEADLPGELGDHLPDGLMLPTDLDADKLRALMEEQGEADAQGLFAMLHALRGEELPAHGQVLPLQTGEQDTRPNLLTAAMAQVWRGGVEGQAQPQTSVPMQSTAQMQSIETLLARAIPQAEGTGREGLSVQMAGDASLGLQPASQQQSGLRVMSLDVPMSQPKWNEAVSNRVLWMVNQNVQGAELRLNPPHLGPLEIRVSMEGDRANVQFLAAHAVTRDALDAAMPRLREMFAENGVQLGNVDVSHREAGDGEQSGQEEGQGAGMTQAEGAAGGEIQDGGISGRPSGLLDAYA
ncbi:flagellar hook-length control protein FliK [Ectothiorhodospira haloalkaliphila]|uniref:flagellar hook-length control protein FliK n=1 Tax=Ectothiorhodospira haloalkaliphila TaxID=421628 RepID=UPI001EE84778|nr:flagellar hook-length control protein FliK [Ectothiorhodospira haloalkaliphila]MCG5525326.1 flagellar hook-length control protein FliK [Ectothiorhodospira haloalkaliphila]